MNLDKLTVVRERSDLKYDARRQALSSGDVASILRPYFADLDREHFVVLLLNAKNRMLGFDVVSVGTVTASLVHPREVFKAAILANATAIILAHNHPSGDPRPSAEDLAITKRLRDAGDLMGIRVMDHVIFGDDAHYSLVDHGE